MNQFKSPAWLSARHRPMLVRVFIVLAFLCSAVSLDAAAPSRAKKTKPQPLSAKASSSAKFITYINEQIGKTWVDNEIAPSKPASDSEWLRRAYLDIVGHIPPAEVVIRFLDDRDRAKRSKMIETLLADSDYVKNWTTIWTNLSIGRRTPQRVSRKGMQQFYEEAFGKNRPWNDVVHDLVGAEGRFDKNGAVNFLLAQMTARDDAVLATAKTTRLFMGIQVQCSQCHDHPWIKDLTQNRFWEFNSFFRQARRVNHRKTDPNTGRMVFDYAELVRNDFDGPVFFENRKGLMQVAYPQFFDTKIDPGPKTDRRRELAKLIIGGSKPLIARAMVNRMWGHFFGYAFTNPVDDMGSHKPPSHPELLDRLTDEFVNSGYDIKQLIRWITNSEAYHLTSRLGKKNSIDDPAAGQMPLFSHMYVKSLEAEQLYDSLIVATNAHQSGRANRTDSEKQRQQWLDQFVIAFGTDENDEATTFNGTIPQALLLMNGQLMNNAISAKEGSYLHQVLSAKGSDGKKIRRLFLSTLSRRPSRREMRKAGQLLNSSGDRLAGYQDLFWALLNSNEFILNH